MSRKSWFWVLVFTMIVTAFLAVPYLLGYLLVRPGTIYTGLLMNPEDAQSYFAKMLQGFDREWLYTIPFTPEVHEPAFLGGFYLALGHLARWTGLSIQMVWHIAQIASAMLLFLATYAFIGAFVKEWWPRWTAFALAVLGSGLGWLLFLAGRPFWLGAFPVDFKMPEAHLFFTALSFPHVALGTALLLVSFLLQLKALSGTGRRWLAGLLAGVANLAIVILYPFMITLVALTVGVYWLVLVIGERRILWRRALPLLPAYLLPAPLLLYYGITLQTNAIFRSWAAQAGTPSPPLPHYLVAYGVMIVLALLPPLFRRERWPAGTFLWCWVGAAALLLYGPIDAQRRFVQGLQVPLAILATMGLFRVVLPAIEQTALFRRLAGRPRYSVEGLRRLLLFFFIALMSLSNIYLLADVSLTAAVRQPYPFFRAQIEKRAVDWLRTNSSRTDVVLAAYQTGNYVAAQAGNRVVIGHWAETVDRDVKDEEVDRFFTPESPDGWRQAFLERYDVTYIWYGSQEKQLGDFDPASADYLQPVYGDSSLVLFQVR